MMDPMKLQMLEEMMVFAGSMATLGCVTGLINTWIRSRGKQVGAGSSAVAPQLEEISARLAQIENTTEATAIEIERISEAQRFTTKLLADRTLPATQANQGERARIGSTTPH